MLDLAKNPALILLSSVVLHSHFKVVTVGEALVVAALSALYAYSLFLDSKKQKPVNQEVTEKLEEMRSTINALKVARAYGR